MSDAGELVHDLLLFVLVLQGIGEFLPGAAAAVLVMLAERLQAVGRWLLYLHQRPLEILLPPLVNPHGDDIPRHGIGHEHDLSVNMRNRLSLSADGLHGHTADYLFFFLSAHKLKMECKYTQKPRA